MHEDMTPKPIQIPYSFEEDSKTGLFLFFWSISSHINSNCSPSSLFHLSLEKGNVSEYKWDQRKRCQEKSHLQMLLGKQIFLDCLPCPVPVPEKPIDQLLKQWSTTPCKSLQILYHWVKTRVKVISLLKLLFFFLQKESNFIFLLHHSSLNICTST